MSRHSPKEIERIKRIAASADFGKPVAQGSLAAPAGSTKERIAHLLRCQNIRLDRVSAHLSNGKPNDGQREIAELKVLVKTLRAELIG